MECDREVCSIVSGEDEELKYLGIDQPILDIAKSLKEYSFIIIGEGSHRAALEKTIYKEKLYNVELVGFKNRNRSD